MKHFKLMLEKIKLQFFASVLEDAKKYLAEPEELEKVLMYSLVTADLVNGDATFDGAKEIKYQHISFGSLEPGTYSFANGYTAMDVYTTWKTMELTQDIGNSISIDKIRDEEAMGNGLVKFANRYIQRIQAPAVDKYRFGVIASKQNTFCKLLTLTKANILDEVIDAKAQLEDARINTQGLVLYVKSGVKASLKKAAVEKGYFEVGNWNGDASVEVEMVDSMKLVSVPRELFQNGVQAIIIHKDAAPAWNKYSETVFFDNIPGHGGRKLQADIGLYHDQFVYDELTRAIFIFRDTAATKYTVTFAKGNDSATGTAPTQADTAPNGEFALPANPFTLLVNHLLVGPMERNYMQREQSILCQVITLLLPQYGRNSIINQNKRELLV